MSIRTILFGLLAILFVWGIYADYSIALARHFLEDGSVDVVKSGAWGDSFGAFNALVSTVAAAVVVYTLILQQKAIGEQAADTHRQKFDTTFFELLRLMRELREELRFTYSKRYKAEKEKKVSYTINTTVVHSGFAAIDAALAEMMFWINEEADPEAVTRERLGKLYMTGIFVKSEPTFSPYFRMIYTILQRIRSDRILSSEEKAVYGNIVRSQITGRELYSLAFNATAPVSKDMADLICEFHLFKYMSRSRARDRVERVYDEAAFAARS